MAGQPPRLWREYAMEDQPQVSMAMSSMVMAKETHSLHDHGFAPWSRRPMEAMGSNLGNPGHGCGG
jgi:hypothetical protein